MPPFICWLCIMNHLYSPRVEVHRFWQIQTASLSFPDTACVSHYLFGSVYIPSVDIHNRADLQNVRKPDVHRAAPFPMSKIIKESAGESKVQLSENVKKTLNISVASSIDIGRRDGFFWIDKVVQMLALRQCHLLADADLGPYVGCEIEMLLPDGDWVTRR
ncbi:hypothetical protein C8R44DRAFT_723989 [Mycena epipterygia]|nr:hypothetical protein C8R44DRAFT_723989 [Mycena epipterygia]